LKPFQPVSHPEGSTAPSPPPPPPPPALTAVQPHSPVSALLSAVFLISPAKYPPIEAWKHLIEKHEASTKGVKM
jgi:hypothetical protein